MDVNFLSTISPERLLFYRVFTNIYKPHKLLNTMPSTNFTSLGIKFEVKTALDKHKKVNESYGEEILRLIKFFEDEILQNQKEVHT